MRKRRKHAKNENIRREINKKSIKNGGSPEENVRSGRRDKRKDANGRPGFYAQREFQYLRYFFLSPDPLSPYVTFLLSGDFPFFIFRISNKYIVRQEESGVSRLFLGHHTILLVASPKSVFIQRALSHAVSYHFQKLCLCALVEESLEKSKYEFASRFLGDSEWSMLLFRKKARYISATYFKRSSIITFLSPGKCII